MPWYRDRDARGLIVRGYLPWLAGLNLAWEMMQLPLYTLWAEATPGSIAFAVAHCTLGDVLIGSAALVLALILGREEALARWRWRRIISLMVLLAAGYTLSSEWLNTTLLRWTYSALMPTFQLAGVQIGLSPVLQWLVIPPLALYLARRTYDQDAPIDMRQSARKPER